MCTCGDKGRKERNADQRVGFREWQRSVNMVRSGVSRYGSGSKKAGRSATKNERLH